MVPRIPKIPIFTALAVLPGGVVLTVALYKGAIVGTLATHGGVSIALTWHTQSTIDVPAVSRYTGATGSTRATWRACEAPPIVHITLVLVCGHSMTHT
jgi:hypothetical protein